MQVKIKRLHKDAVIPYYSKKGDAGLDLTAINKYYDEYGNVHYDTGLAFEIPEGFVGLLFPRSSNAKKDLLLSNSVGVVDSNFRGSVSLKFKPSAVLYSKGVAEYPSLGNMSHNFDSVRLPESPEEIVKNGLVGVDFQEYEVGDRVGQLIILPYPKIELVEVDELSDTERGSGGYGSSGK